MSSSASTQSGAGSKRKAPTAGSKAAKRTKNSKAKPNRIKLHWKPAPKVNPKTGLTHKGKPPHKTAVPELLRKKIALGKIRKARKVREIEKAAVRDRWRQKQYFIRAEKYVNEYRKTQKIVHRNAKIAKKQGNFYVPAQPRLAIVIRIRGILGISPKPRKVLQLLRLRQLHNAVFVRLNKATLSMLKIAEPYIAWGYPTLKTVRHLIYKRGFLNINHSRQPIRDNKQIEEKLGKEHNIICVEDVIHEIFTVGRSFPTVNRALWPFKLNNPRGGFRDKGTHFVEGGDAGNREDLINHLVQRML